MYPSENDIKNYVDKVCGIVGLPSRIGIAICKTESDFKQYNLDGTLLVGRYDQDDRGAMQVNRRVWGQKYNVDDLDNSWQYNIKAGVEIAYEMYKLAVKNKADSLHQATYSAYNAGPKKMFRYQNGKDARDENFIKNYNECNNY